MLFKKEFDIDKDFFTEETKGPKKRSIALKVFLSVMFLTFAVLCYSAFTYNFNLRFGSFKKYAETGGLKEAQEYFYDAVKFYDSGQYDKAIQYLNRQLEIVDDPDAYNYLAKIYLEQGDIDSAISYFKKALEFKPDFFEANYELGKIYFEKNDYRSASKYFTAASNQQIDNLEVLSLTAECYKMTGKSDEAITLLEKILRLEPESTFANAKIGEIYFQKLQYKKAVPYFEEALFANFDENIAIQLAKSYFELGKYTSALDLADEILAENKENKAAQSIKRVIEYKQGIVQTAPDKPVQNKIKDEKPLDPSIVQAYINEIELSIKMNWTPPAGSNLNKVSVKFTVNKEGELISNAIYATSGMADFDKSALEAIEMSKPFPPLPDSIERETLDIIFTFDFNVK